MIRRTGYRPTLEVLEDRLQLSVTVQFDVSSVLNADVIVNRTGESVDFSQSPVDLAGNQNYSLATQSAVDGYGYIYTPHGLPDNGTFYANGDHPFVRLPYDNSSFGDNARRADVNGLVLPVSQFGFSINTPNDFYSGVHVFLTAGLGSASFSLTLTYTDGTSTTASVTVPDWNQSVGSLPPATESVSPYVLVGGMDRIKADVDSYDDADDYAVYGFRFTADPNKQLQSFTLTPVSVTGSIVFLGATGEVAPHVELTGADSVQAGQVYTLGLAYTTPLDEGESFVGWTINWGDGVIEATDGNPAEVTHVYTDAPNAYLITATATTTLEPQVRGQLLVDVLIPVVASSDSTVLTGRGTTSVTTPDGTATAIVTRNGDFREPLIVFLAHYAQDPNLGASSDVTQVGGVTFVNGADGQRIETTAYDLRVTNARPGDVVFVFFNIPQPSVAPTLRFIDPVTGVSSPIVGSTNPRYLAQFGLTPKQVAGTFMVILDFTTSFPTLSQLRGTVFTISDLGNFVPPIISLFGANQSRNLAANTDILGALLRDDDDDDAGTQIGAIAPTVSSSAIGGGSDPTAEEAAQARQRRELLGTVESIMQQLRQMFGTQLQLFVDGLMASARTLMTPQAEPPPMLVETAVVDDRVGVELPQQLETPVPRDPLSPAIWDEVIPTADGNVMSLLNRQMLPYAALAAIPFVPWADVFGNPEAERRRTLSLK